MRKTGIKGNIHTVDITGFCILYADIFSSKNILPRIEIYIVYVYGGLVLEKILNEENLNII